MLNIIASILSYDIWFYISHRLLHTPELYGYHRIHHEKGEPTAWDTYLSQWMEGPFQGAGAIVPAIWFSYSLMDILIVLAFLNVRGMLRHDDRFSWLLGNHHVLHHRYPTYNFGERWLDYLGGTQFPRKEECVKGIIPFN
jgi:sterol desaturase/sphingolipid hydroxylase (fatty acid hydroxylase superfamily)